MSDTVTLPASTSLLDHTKSYHLEYLLSNSDRNDVTLVTKRNKESLPHLSDAEYYSFEDYQPSGFGVCDGNYVQLDEFASLQTPPKQSAMKPSRSHPHFNFDYSESLYENIGHKMVSVDDQMLHSISRNGSSGSSSSTSSASGTNSIMSKPSKALPWHQRKTAGILHGKEKMVYKRKSSGALPLSSASSSSTSGALPLHNLQAAARRSQSTSSFQRYSMLWHPNMDTIESPAACLSSISFSETKSRADNHKTSNRTEELLNGIVKLAEVDVIDPPQQHSKKAPSTVPTTKKKLPLNASSSTPMMSKSHSDLAISGKDTSGDSHSKPVSPVSHRKFTFSRKGSFSYHHHHHHHNTSSDTDKKHEKKHKNHTDPKVFLEAVEHFDIDSVVCLLSADSSCINQLSSEGLSALDIAVLTNHVPMIKVLKRYGATIKLLADQTDCNLCKKLESLITAAEHQIRNLKSASASGHSVKENEKKINQWEFKHRLFKRMKSGYEQAGLPGQPRNVKLSVASDSSLNVKFDSPENVNGAVVTRYKVEWSSVQNFKPLVGEVFIHDIQNLQFEITGLESGTPYYVKVTAWNMKGFGRSAYSDPPYAIPSNWRDVEHIQARSSLYDMQRIDDIASAMRNLKNSLEVTENTGSHSHESPHNQRKTSASVPLMRGLRGLFSSNLKFHKTLKRGVYLACVCYCDDKILVTHEDSLPVIEVDESYGGSSLQADFDWLMKVLASPIDTVRQIKHDLERLAELSSIHLKHQLLSAVLQIQEAIGTQSFGKLFYKPISDGNGSVVLVIVNQITDTKLMANVSSALKWQSQSKLVKNMTSSDPLLPYLNEIKFFHKTSTNPIGRGLYLGYLHIKINVDAIRVLTPETSPSILPYIKVRDCPNVSKPEWESLLNLMPHVSGRKSLKESNDVVTFKKQIMKSAKKLADKLGMNAEQMADHRLYDVEVLEFSKDVSFILLIPPRDLVCSVHSHSSGNNQMVNFRKDYMEIPVKAFEIVHLLTYHSEFLNGFAKVACLVDSQLALAQQSHREAFLNEELEKSKYRVDVSKRYQHQLEEIWRSTRWLMDAITYARDKNTQGIGLAHLYNSIVEQSSSTTHDNYGKNFDDGYHSDKISIGGSTASEKTAPSTAGDSNQNQHKNTNNNNGQYYDGELDYHHQPTQEVKPLEPGILRVYAAYNSGLARGTSVMLHVTPKTTAREVINLVIMQLNQAVIRKGLSSPVYSEDEFMDFCLVAVIGPRERVLRDDYKLLQLQNPWTKGKLYVRLKDNLLAALEHGETTEV